MIVIYHKTNVHLKMLYLYILLKYLRVQIILELDISVLNI